MRVYDGDDWSTPMLEFALEDLSNPQDAVLCDGKLWVTQHNAARITAHDPETGLIVDAIDLSPWAGSDGAAEASVVSLTLLPSFIPFFLPAPLTFSEPKCQRRE